MRYLVCSDIHLNLNRRFEDTVDALEQIRQLVKTQNVNRVLVLGDVYTNRRPHSKEKTAFHQWLYKITKPILRTSVIGFQDVVDVVLLIGNHDEYPDGIHSYSEFTELKFGSVTVLDNPSVFNGFFLGHLLLQEAKMGPLDYQSPNCTSAKELIAKYPNCKAYLLGDVHKAQTIQKDPLVIYAGSINRVDFGERDDEKSVLIIDDKPKFTCRRIVLKSRPMIQVDTDIRGMYSPPDMKWYPDIKGAIFKFVFHGTPDELAQVNEAELRELFKDTKELIIQYDVRKESIARDERVTENITPQQALELYLEKLDLQPEERVAIIELSQRVMEDATT